MVSVQDIHSSPAAAGSEPEQRPQPDLRHQPAPPRKMAAAAHPTGGTALLHLAYPLSSGEQVVGAEGKHQRPGHANVSRVAGGSNAGPTSRASASWKRSPGSRINTTVPSPSRAAPPRPGIEATRG